MRKKGPACFGRQDNELIYDPLSIPKHRALQCLYINAKQSISVDNKGETPLARFTRRVQGANGRRVAEKQGCGGKFNP
jgi:hypothetical protein